MRSNTLFKFSACLLLALIAGCGQEGVAVDAQEEPAVEEIKSTLLAISESGVVGSGGYSLQQQIERLQESDPAKAEELSKQVTELEQLDGQPAKVKAKAKAIAEGL